MGPFFAIIVFGMLKQYVRCFWYGRNLKMKQITCKLHPIYMEVQLNRQCQCAFFLFGSRRLDFLSSPLRYLYSITIFIWIQLSRLSKNCFQVFSTASSFETMQFVFGDLIFTTKMTVLLSSGTVGYRRVQEPSSRYTTGISVGSNVNGAELYSSIILCFPRSYSNTRLNKTTNTKYIAYVLSV